MNIADKSPDANKRVRPTIDRPRRASAAGSILVIAGGAAAAVALAATISLFVSRSAGATPAYATQTGKACTQCHTTAAGGALTPYGGKFQADGHKMPAEAPK
jgi:hypothetical protein